MSIDEHDDLRRALAPLARPVDPALAWERMERRLDDPTPAPRRDHRTTFAFAGVMATVAVVAAVVVTQGTTSTGGAPHVVQPPSASTGEPSPSSAPSPVDPELAPPAGVTLAAAARNHIVPASATWLSATQGWVAAARCADSQCSSVVDATTDGGVTWKELDDGTVDVSLTPNADPQGPTGSVTLVAADAHDLLALEARGSATEVEVSHSGGHSWSVVPELKGTATAVATSDGWWVLTGDDHKQLWQLGAGASTPTLIGSPSSSAQLAAGDGAAYLVDDGKVNRIGTGSSYALPAPQGVLTVSPTGVLILSEQTDGAAGSGTKKAWRSTDGGATWTPLPDPPLAGDLRSLTELSPGHLVLDTASGASTLSVSSDGGGTWHDALRFGDGGLGISTPQAVDATHAFVVYGSPSAAAGSQDASTADAFGVYETGDGGATWTRVTTLP